MDAHVVAAKNKKFEWIFPSLRPFFAGLFQITNCVQTILIALGCLFDFVFKSEQVI
jgi:uncharacterized protein YybS (DUF2232 family)